MTTVKITNERWEWWNGHLVTCQHGKRVVLTADRPLLVRHPLEDGELVELHPDDDVARLIAAAPELLAACEEVLARMEGHNLGWGDAFSAASVQLEEAIKKARGES